MIVKENKWKSEAFDYITGRYSQNEYFFRKD